MQLLTGKTVHRWWSELYVAPSGQKTKQSEVAGEYAWRHRYVSAASRNVTIVTTEHCCCLDMARVDSYHCYYIRPSA